MDHDKIMELDPIIHAPTRLAILSMLIGVESATFAYLKGATNTTDGNLSTHLTKMEKANYITIEKKFVGKKPQTNCAITSEGRSAFMNYLTQMERIVQSQKPAGD